MADRQDEHEVRAGSNESGLISGQQRDELRAAARSPGSSGDEAERGGVKLFSRRHAVSDERYPGAAGAASF